MPKENKTQVYTLRVQEETRQALLRISEKTGLGVSTLIRMAVTNHIDDLEKNGFTLKIPPEGEGSTVQKAIADAKENQAVLKKAQEDLEGEGEAPLKVGDTVCLDDLGRASCHGHPFPRNSSTGSTSSDTLLRVAALGGLSPEGLEQYSNLLLRRSEHRARTELRGLLERVLECCLNILLPNGAPQFPPLGESPETGSGPAAPLPPPASYPAPSDPGSKHKPPTSAFSSAPPATPAPAKQAARPALKTPTA